MRKRIWGWMMFDWASQPFATLILTFIFGPYFVSVASGSFMAEGLAESAADAQAQSMWSLGQSLTGVLIAITAPFLGAFADTTGRRMPWIILFSVFYVAGALGLWWLGPDGSFLWGALVCFGIGLIGAEFATLFTNSLLPELGNKDEIGRISGNGFAIGYVGGVISLLIMLLFFVETESGTTAVLGLEPAFGLDPEMREGTRFVGPFVALWYLVSMTFFFLWVREPRKPNASGAMRAALRSLKASLLSLPSQRSLSAYLASSMLYRDALNALYAFGGTYATLVLDWSITQVGVFGIIGVISAALFAWLGGKADMRFGPKPVITVCILLLIIVSTTIFSMSREGLWGLSFAADPSLPDTIFYICGAVIGAAGGVMQSASRSMMVRQANPARPSEAFGLFALSGKATAFLGPALIGIVTYATGSARMGIAPVIFLFLLGLLLLIWVKADGWTETT
jgi:UMF1 family MFS transporter